MTRGTGERTRAASDPTPVLPGGCELELNRTLSLVLHHQGAQCHLVPVANVSGPGLTRSQPRSLRAHSAASNRVGVLARGCGRTMVDGMMQFPYENYSRARDAPLCTGVCATSGGG